MILRILRITSAHRQAGVDEDKELAHCKNTELCGKEGRKERRKKTSTVPGQFFSQVAGVHWEKFHHKFEKNLLRILKHNIFISFLLQVY